MPRASRPWFRFYVEAVSDQKLRRLTPAQRWLWVSVLAAARQSPMSGLLMISEREALSTADLADLAAMPCKEVARTLPVFERAGMLNWDEKLEAWQVKNWNVRQFESDNVTERTRKFRSDEHRNPVPGNTSRNVPTSFLGTRPETETESESESSSRATPQRPPPDEPVDDDDETRNNRTIAAEAAAILASRALATTPTDVGNTEAWLAKTAGQRLERHRITVAGLDLATFESADELANYLEPPRARNGHSAVPAQLAAQRIATESDLEPCPKCHTRGGLGWIPAGDGNGVIRCPACTPQPSRAVS